MRLVPALLAILIGFSIAPASALGPEKWMGNYTGPGTVVASFGFIGSTNEQQATFVDNGAIVCEDVNGDQVYEKSRGGTCIPFQQMDDGSARFDSILVEDALAHTDVAFQVCVDMNADNLCGSGVFANGLVGSGPCPDLILFSHSSSTGRFDNPMWVDHQAIVGQWASCTGGTGFAGYVVILCAGAHQVRSDPEAHTHEATFGQVYATFGGTPASGDYCGSPVAVKAYEVLG